MHTQTPPTTSRTHRIAAGQAQGLPLGRGSEVFCSQGQVRLTLVPTGQWDGCCGHTVRLAQGQGWRAPQDTWVQLAADGTCAPHGTGLVRITPSPAQQQDFAPRKLALWRRLVLRLAGRPWQGQGVGRAQRAA